MHLKGFQGAFVPSIVYTTSLVHNVIVQKDLHVGEKSVNEL